MKWPWSDTPNTPNKQEMREIIRYLDSEYPNCEVLLNESGDFPKIIIHTGEKGEEYYLYQITHTIINGCEFFYIEDDAPELVFEVRQTKDNDVERRPDRSVEYYEDHFNY